MEIKELVRYTDLLNQNSKIIACGELDDYKCSRNPGATKDAIHSLAQTYNLVVPDSLQSFWLESDGITFNQFGGTRFYSLHDVEGYLIAYDDLLAYGVYPIAAFDDDTILLDSSRIASGEYLFYGDACGLDYFYPLHCGFEFFLEKMIWLCGYKYWDWLPLREDERTSFERV